MNLEDIYEIMNEKNKHNIIYDSELLVQESYKNNFTIGSLDDTVGGS